MATANSSFLPKKFKTYFILFLAFTACQTGPKQSPSSKDAVTVGSDSKEKEPEIISDEETLDPAGRLGVAPKVGLILGPGALRSYAHIGVVQEFAKQKMPIHVIGGIEMGALVAAIYANKGQPYDVEWQLMKLKESDLVQQELLSSQVKLGDVRNLRSFMKLALSSSKAENSKVHFVCPAYQMEKQQVFLMNRGAYSDMLPFCLAFPPLFKPYQQNVSAMFSLKTLIDYMRSKGATYVIYVDLLSGPVKMAGSNTESEVLWSLVAEASRRQEKGLDHVIHVPLKNFDLLDFNHRREMIQKGQQAAQGASSVIRKSINW